MFLPSSRQLPEFGHNLHLLLSLNEVALAIGSEDKGKEKQMRFKSYEEEARARTLTAVLFYQMIL